MAKHEGEGQGRKEKRNEDAEEKIMSRYKTERCLNESAQNDKRRT